MSYHLKERDSKRIQQNNGLTGQSSSETWQATVCQCCTWTKINNWSYCSQDGEANIFRSGITLEYLMASTIVLIFRDAKSKDDLAPLFQVLRSPSIPGDIGYSFGPGGFTADGLERCQQPHFCGISEQGPV
ncbi:hypothetical protein Y1Q_0002448 [Alligator mississippiensis]|uniref:Uncharacterized protein n=1 Tax=Alligator mississippiensis TaxID=8496 RepID=A0A151NY14_ALLMI|nr:hypothetical protein Y1Q_0002448 [Alligator mississippiensis]